MARLRRSDPSEPGLARKRSGRGFTYLDPSGARVTDPETVERIRDLAIPPAWRDVWICPDPWGHIQAVGVDAAGRRQYRYHDRWRKRRDQAKFERMIRFGRALPPLRVKTARHLAKKGYPKERVLACAVRLLDVGFFRVGSEEYAEENQTFGLATMQKRHVRVKDEMVTFDYPAKGGKRRIQSVVDPDVCKVLKGLKSRGDGGKELLAYREGRRWVDVKSSDINDYIKSVAGEDFTSKDFRTWNATVLAAVALAISDGRLTSRSSRKRVMSSVVREVAEYLGNTPAVCRSSYIDPRVFDRYRGGVTIRPALGAVEAIDPAGMPALHRSAEEAVLDLLQDEFESNVKAA
jgi:DNA topoisomerase-1